MVSKKINDSQRKIVLSKPILTNFLQIIPKRTIELKILKQTMLNNKLISQKNNSMKHLITLKDKKIDSEA